MANPKNVSKKTLWSCLGIARSQDKLEDTHSKYFGILIKDMYDSPNLLTMKGCVFSVAFCGLGFAGDEDLLYDYFCGFCEYLCLCKLLFQ